MTEPIIGHSEGIVFGPEPQEYYGYSYGEGDHKITPANDTPPAPDEKAQETIKPDFSAMGLRIGKIVDEKDRAYGDSVRRSAKIMEILYPHGIGRGDYVFALLNLRIIDKLCRSSSDPWAFGENPYEDIGGYAIRGSEIAKETIETYRKILDTVE